MGTTINRKAGGNKGSAKGKADATAGCRKCKRWREVKQRMRVAQFIEKTVSAVEDKLDQGTISPTVAEYLKLLQLEQEWEQHESLTDAPKEIKVTWVGPEAQSNDET